MKRIGIGLLAAAMGASALPAQALDVYQSARLGELAGAYHLLQTSRIFDANGNFLEEIGIAPRPEFAVGLTAGYTLLLDRVYGDLALELLRINGSGGGLGFDRTDVLATLGVYVVGDFSVFGGFRRAWEGDHFFQGKFVGFNSAVGADVATKWWEIGPYVGLGYSGIPLGRGYELNTSVAYNFDRVRDFPADSFTMKYRGVSAKIGLNKSGSPHALQVRGQYFRARQSFEFDDGSTLALRYSETYLLLSYLYSWSF